MQPDALAGPGRYRCRCGARIGVKGLPQFRADRCSRVRALHGDPYELVTRIAAELEMLASGSTQS